MQITATPGLPPIKLPDNRRVPGRDALAILEALQAGGPGLDDPQAMKRMGARLLREVTRSGNTMRVNPFESAAAKGVGQRQSSTLPAPKRPGLPAPRPGRLPSLPALSQPEPEQYQPEPLATDDGITYDLIESFANILPAHIYGAIEELRNQQVEVTDALQTIRLQVGRAILEASQSTDIEEIAEMYLSAAAWGLAFKIIVDAWSQSGADPNFVI